MFVGAAPLTGLGQLFTIAHADETIMYGNYPKSRILDSGLREALNAVDTPWISYDYYSGTGSSNGQMTPGDFMKYRDVYYGGAKYRGVYFTSYRPYETNLAASSSNSNSYQDENGYTPGSVYWFRFEPIQWRVLDEDTGLILSESILDSQPYNNYILKYDGNGDYYGDSERSRYANDYYNSSLRQWLNDDFYNTAFTPAQKENIVETELDNSCAGSTVYNSASGSDKIFLLSFWDASNGSYGFDSDNSRYAQGTDYAKCQGLYVHTNAGSWQGNSNWWLRTPGYTYGAAAAFINHKGTIDNSSLGTDYTSRGIRPACRLNVLESDTDIEYDVSYDTIQYGNYPQSLVTDSDVISSLDSSPGKVWVDYGYYTGTGNYSNGQMTQASI